ncbi:hypothetical protein QR97_15555 [Streptomyces sp. PBH53]|nr:hypothetical protein QR97_15555 [Streptomyces sp. PBH53]
MPPPDVELLPLAALRLLRARCVQVVEPAEEQRGVAEVGQRLDALVDLALQDLGVDPVRRDIADVQRLHVLAHGAQGGPGRGEVGALSGEGIVEGGGERVVGGRGQGGASGGPAAWATTMPSGFRPDDGTPRGRRARAEILGGAAGRVQWISVRARASPRGHGRPGPGDGLHPEAYARPARIGSADRCG